jgi:exopolysaccharide biosynthesis polyprenyl glycosylphosphotransferase
LNERPDGQAPVLPHRLTEIAQLRRLGEPLPAQRQPLVEEGQPPFVGRHQVSDRAASATDVLEPSEYDSRATVVMPDAATPTARRTRVLRAWMIALPVDAATLLVPLFWRTDNWRGMVSMAALTIVLFAAGGHYRGRRHLSILDEIPSLVGRLLTSAAVVAIIVAERHGSATYVREFLQTVALSLVLLLVGRTITRKMVIVARRRRWVQHGAVIVGGGPVAAELARLLRRYPQYGLRFAGFIDDDAASHWSSDLKPWIGSLDDIESLVQATESDVIIVADGNYAESRAMHLIRQPACMTRDLWVVPRLHDFQSTGGQVDHIGAIPVMRIRRPTMAGPRWVLKRIFDIFFSGLSLVLVSPVLLICAIAVRLEGGPGIFFHQERIGRDGKPFDLIKFRSMKPANETESQTNWSVATDPRVGPVGRLLRRTSLDEVPQLWNILRGDMTLVGPRPERPFFVAQFSTEHPGYDLRHRVPVGLTGLAQVSGLRGDTPISDRARFDNYYIENWSLWLDVKVLLRTFAEVFRGGGR